MDHKTPLFSVTQSDFDWQYMRGTGPGGQKRNKTESKVRCVHKESGATGESDETRSQHENKKLAFKKAVNSKEFQNWLKIKSSKNLGLSKIIDEKVEEQMNQKYIRVEYKDENGKWVQQINT